MRYNPSNMPHQRCSDFTNRSCVWLKLWRHS